MNNDEYFNAIKNSYESLNNFFIKNNTLILKKNDNYSGVVLNNTKLESLNPKVFMLRPSEILEVIYTLEIIAKQEINEEELSFVQKYASKYYELNKKTIDESIYDDDRLWCLRIPILLSYDPEYENNPGSVIIHNIILNSSTEYEKGKGTSKAYVRTLPQFKNSNDDNLSKELEKAGFATLFLIFGAVIGTCIYLAMHFFN